MSDRDPYESNLQTAMEGWAANTWSKVLVATFLVYIMLGGITVLPEGGVFDLLGLLFLGAFVVCWIPFPIWLYNDRKRVVEETDYSPSKLYYLGWLPSYLGAGAIVIYLHRRGEAYRAVDRSEDTSGAGDATSTTAGAATESAGQQPDSDYEF